MGKKPSPQQGLKREIYQTFHSCPNAILITRLSDGSIMYVNRGFEEIFGYPSSEAVGKTTLDLHLWVKDADCQQVVAELSAKGEVQSKEFQFWKNSGGGLTGLFFAEILDIENERLVLTSICDITEQEQADQTIPRMTSFPIENPEPVLRVGRDGCLLFANLAAFVLLPDWKLELGKSIPYELARSTRAVFETQKSIQIEIPSGESIFSIVIAPVVKNEYVHLYGHDVTKLKNLEEKIISSEEHYRRAFKAARDGILILDASTGIIVDANLFMLDLLGFSLEELIGKYIWELGTFKDIAANKVEFLKLQREEFVQYEGLPLISADGRQTQVEFVSHVYPVNHKMMMQCNIRDITPRLLEEEKLRKSEEHFRELVEHASDGIFMTDADGRYIEVNSSGCGMLGYTRSEILQKSMRDLIAPDELASKPLQMEDLHAGEAILTERQMIRKDGSRLAVEISGKQLPDGRLQEIVRDITLRKRTEAKFRHTFEELQRSNAELEQFAFVASHDLKEPLRMVMSYVQLLERRYKGKLDDDADDFIGFAVEGTLRMQDLVNDLLAFSRVGTHTQLFVPTSSDIALSKALDNLQNAIRESKAKITRDPLPEVMADETQLVQLFQNLVGNAVKFHGDKAPRVRISVDEHEKEWVFSVRDNGIGINPKYGEQVFNIFQRLHDRSQYSGDGIGLAVCKKIVQRHGGSIWVESQLGKGATFYFTLPKTGGK